jgi:biopolymer transport protein ExbB/TolQ
MVLLILSLYFIATFWIFIYRYRLIVQRLHIESRSLSRLYMGRSDGAAADSLLAGYLQQMGRLSPEILKAAINDAVRSATRGLTQLSIMASTSPFIGLFGTVVGILEAFGRLGAQKSASLSVVAPAISEALIATAAGIFVAIFAYAFHLLLKRKAYELQSLLESQSDIILAQAREVD